MYTAAGAGLARPLPKGARFGGVTGGLVVYRAGSTARILRLSDGRDRRLVTLKGLADVQITPAGVFYAAEVPAKGGVRGLVAYVPMRDALHKLR